MANLIWISPFSHVPFMGPWMVLPFVELPCHALYYSSIGRAILWTGQNTSGQFLNSRILIASGYSWICIVTKNVNWFSQSGGGVRQQVKRFVREVKNIMLRCAQGLIAIQINFRFLIRLWRTQRLVWSIRSIPRKTHPKWDIIYIKPIQNVAQQAYKLQPHMVTAWSPAACNHKIE